MKGVLETSFIQKILPSAAADLFYILFKTTIENKTKKRVFPEHFNKSTIPNRLCRKQLFTMAPGGVRVSVFKHCMRSQRNMFMLF